MGPIRIKPSFGKFVPLPLIDPVLQILGPPPDGQILGPPLSKGACTPMPAISPNFQKKIPARTIQTERNTSQGLSIMEILTAK